MSALRWVLRFGRSGRSRLFAAMLLGALASSAAVGLTATSAWLISRASQHPPVLHLMVAIVAVRTFGVARGVLRYAERLAGHDASFRILGDLRVAAVAQLERDVPIRSAVDGERFGSGELLARFVGDIDSLQDLWVRVLLPYGSAALVGAGSVALVAALHPGVGVVLAMTLVVTALVAPVLSTRSSRSASTALAPLRGTYQSEVVELLDGATELSVYGALPARLARLEAIDRELTRSERRAAVGAGNSSAVATGAGGLALWIALWLGAKALRNGSLGAVNLAVVVLVPLAVHEIYAALVPAAQQLPALAGAARRVRALFDRNADTVDPDVGLAVPDGPYGLRIRGLHARWAEQGPEVLAGVDLDVQAESCTLIVGRSGSGKSTLAALLTRLLEPLAGTVELVGSSSSVDISHMRADDVRSVIGWCAQDAYIFDSTLEANLRLAHVEATTEQIWEALDRARLGGFVRSLPLGLGTMVGEHGAALSGGQRQRLALARVLLADRPVVVFDEPTEHLDDLSASALAADLMEATAGRTTLIVTHRPELFPGVTRIVTLEDGVVSSPVRTVGR